MPMNDFWTDERVEACRVAWCIEGKTATQIATELNAASRNSILSKVHRMGWTGPNSWGVASPKKGVPRHAWGGAHRPTARKIAAGRGAAIDLRAQRSATAERFAERQATTTHRSTAPVGPKSFADIDFAIECKWPIGDSDFLFCAAPRELPECSPYCELHSFMAYGTRMRRQPKRRMRNGESTIGRPRPPQNEDQPVHAWI